MESTTSASTEVVEQTPWPSPSECSTLYSTLDDFDINDPLGDESMEAAESVNAARMHAQDEQMVAMDHARVGHDDEKRALIIAAETEVNHYRNRMEQARRHGNPEHQGTLRDA